MDMAMVGGSSPPFPRMLDLPLGVIHISESMEHTEQIRTPAFYSRTNIQKTTISSSDKLIIEYVGNKLPYLDLLK